MARLEERATGSADGAVRHTTIAVLYNTITL